MSIIASELVWRKSAVMADGATNGGRMTPTASPTQTKNNIWPDIPQSERAAGSTKYRKMFVHVANDTDLDLIQARVFVETPSPGDDSVMLFLGTQTDQESAITGSEPVFGAGQLNADVTAGGTTITVNTEGAAFNMFRNGEMIRISDKTDVNDAGGNEQYVLISGAPSYGGDVATITLADNLAHNFLAANTRVSSVIQAGDVSGSVTSFTVTSGSGTFDDTTYPVLPDHIGCIEQDWTLDFSDSTTFDLIGDTLGNIGTFTIASDLQPNNADFSKPYFFMDNAGFGGTFTNGDTITFTTSPAAIPVWYKRVVPAAAASLSANKVIVGVDGQSA